MKIEVEKDNERLDFYLSGATEISRSKLQKLIKEGKILVNDKEVASSYKVKVGDVVTINDELDFTIDLVPENIPLDIVYEDDDLIIINKVSGMVVHPAAGNYEHTLVNALLYHFNKLSEKDLMRPGIVHRIDKDTSGLMVVAKNDEVHEKLASMIKEKEVTRIYYALVEGIIPHETGTIDAPIGRDLDNRLKMKVTSLNSKHAITHFRVLERYKDKTLIECKLETGRTHQIRVHLAYIGYPIYNDPVYGKSKNTTEFGQFLHSKKISFIHPSTGNKIDLEVDLPKEFAEYLKELKNEL